jgi:transcription initiation factor IIF auxiliary subunit
VDLDKVQKVEYLLHPTFSNPVAVSEDPTNDFEVWIWAWGGFPITATITTKTGQIFEKNYDFSFKTKFEEAQSKRIPQMMECNDVQ